MPKQRCSSSGKSRSLWCNPCQGESATTYAHRKKCEGLREQVQGSQGAAEVASQACAVCTLPTQEAVSCHEEQRECAICSACMRGFSADQIAASQPRAIIPVPAARVQSFLNGPTTADLMQNTSPSDADLRPGKRATEARRSSRSRSSTLVSSAAFMESQGYSLRNYRTEILQREKKVSAATTKQLEISEEWRPRSLQGSYRLRLSSSSYSTQQREGGKKIARWRVG